MGKTKMRYVLFFLTVFMHTNALLGKEWNGIKPLLSTKEAVIQVLGKPSEENEVRLIYHLQDEDVFIVLTNNREFSHECVRKQKLGIVLLIEVTPKKKFSLQDMKFEETAMRTFDPATPAGIGYKGFVNEREGIVIRTFDGYVDRINYIATIEDSKLCSEYYAKPEKFVSIRVHVAPSEKPKAGMPSKKMSIRKKKRVDLNEVIPHVNK